jgi:hypothetical protein
MSLTKSRKALVTALRSIPDVATAHAAKQVAMDNFHFTPPTGTRWYEVHWAPNIPVAVECGDNGEDEATGFLQVDVVVPLNKGLTQAEALVGAILTKFKTGSKFTYEGQSVMVTSCGAAPGFPVDNGYKVPVTINFQHRHSRSAP